jgi:hypothetical protein
MPKAFDFRQTHATFFALSLIVKPLAKKILIGKYVFCKAKIIQE